MMKPVNLDPQFNYDIPKVEPLRCSNADEPALLASVGLYWRIYWFIYDIKHAVRRKIDERIIS